MQKKIFTTEVGGKTLTAEFNDLAMQANGSCLVSYGNTTVLATAVMGSQEREGLDYFPLTVDYEEKFYAAGAILGSKYVRREGRPSDEAILSGRAVDRTVRPLFDARLRVEVQVVITILSIGEDDPDVVSVLAASLALATSDIPWAGPVGAVRLGLDTQKNWIVNPTYDTRETNVMDILVCGQNGLINMIETGALQIPEETIIEALTKASAEITALEAFQNKVIKEIGKEKKVFSFPELSTEARDLFAKEIEPKLASAVFTGISGGEATGELHTTWKTLLKEQLPDENRGLADLYFEEKVESAFDEGVLEGRRPDGRDFDEVRAIYAQAGGVAPMLHGAGIFYRGETHIFAALTLGGPDDIQELEGMEVQRKKHFMLHYNFPPYSTGETGRMGGTNRRMIGHGALAEKALLAVIPPKELFPYTIRLVSEVMSSNGSSSMGSVCGGTLALLDGGVPIASPVAGIAMGVVIGENNAYKVLTDIQGPEDHYGDMDFKVAGTRDGVTAMQMDVKVAGVPLSVFPEAFEKAKRARLHILEKITEAIPEARADISPLAPKILVTKIKKDQIGLVIGGGGKTVNQIRDLTGAEISIEEDGTVFVTGKNGAAEKALKIIEAITREFHAGETFQGEVTRIAEFGAFVRLGEDTGISGMKGTEGLVHISEIAPFRIGNVEDVLKEGEIVPVVIKEMGEEGRIRLSIKDIDPEFASRKGVAPFEGPLPQNDHPRRSGSSDRPRRFGGGHGGPRH
ncbi:MAG: polyribonucleotide nucleotidyltransferase [Candidatus Campbellbacteria bacterium]